MAVEFRLPDLGENIEAGEVVNVLVSVGDAVAVDQPVIELETDKAVIEVPSSVSGTVTAVHVGKGDRAQVGQPVLTIEGVAAAAPAPPQAPAAPPAGPGRAVEVALPELGEGVGSGDVVGVLVAVGDQVAADQPLLEIEIDKGIVEMPSPMAGRVRQVHVSPGDRVSVGQPIVTLESVAGAAAQEKVGKVSFPTSAAPSRLVPAAPSVRRLAREIGVDIAQVRGSGPGGRISEDDVKGHAKALNQGRGAAPLGAPAPPPLPDLEKWGPVERHPMSNVRRLTAEHMRRSWTTIPHVTQFDRADVTELEAFRKQYGPRAVEAGGKLTPTAIVLKVAANGTASVANTFSGSMTGRPPWMAPAGSWKRTRWPYW